MSIEFGSNPTGLFENLDQIASIITDWSFVSHSELSDLGNDDHVHYHTDVRGDLRYLYRENTVAFTPDGDYEPSTKKYVDDCDYINFENALTKAGGLIKLGGLLTGNTAIDGLYDLKFGDSIALNIFSAKGDSIILSGEEDGNNSTRLEVTANNAAGKWLILNTKIGGTTYTIQSDEGGLYCGGDYSGDYTDRHLIDKAYVVAHTSLTNNPHTVTKTQVGLSAVTNNAQVKKITSNTNNNVPQWDGTTGDLLKDGYPVETAALVGASGKLAEAGAIKAYVDAASSGLDIKEPCRLASTANVAIATALEAGDTIDGTVLVQGDRVFLKDQTAIDENGIYVAVAAAGGAASRATDADHWDNELVQAYAFITDGTANAGSSWVCNISAGGVLETDPIPVIQFFDATAYSAGDGLDLTGTTFSTDLAASGGLEIVGTELKVIWGGSGSANSVSHSDHTQNWATVTSTPTTFSGYSISDTLANLNTAISDADLYSQSAIDTWRNGVTQTDMGYLATITSSVQAQIDSKDNYGYFYFKVNSEANHGAQSVVSHGYANIIGGDEITVSRSATDITIDCDITVANYIPTSAFTLDNQVLTRVPTGTIQGLTISTDSLVGRNATANLSSINMTHLRGADGKSGMLSLGSFFYTETESNAKYALISHNHSASNITSGTFGVARGGTGLASIATNRILTGNGTSAMTAEPNLLFTGSLLTVTGTVVWTGGGSANANTAYTHSQDNTQAHSDYLLNNASDSTSGTLTAANFMIGSDEVFHEGHEDWQTDPGGSTASWNMATSRNFEWTMDGSGTLSISGADNGSSGVLVLKANGSYTCTLPSGSTPASLVVTASDNVLAVFTRLNNGNYIWSSHTFLDPV